MNSRAWKRFWSLGFVVIFSSMNSLILSGQSDSEMLVFEPPTASNSVRQANEASSSKQTTAGNTATGNTVVGKASVTKKVGTKPLKSSSGSTAANDTKRVSPEKPALSNANRSAEPASKVIKDQNIRPASSTDQSKIISPDGGDMTLPPQRKNRAPEMPPMMVTPMDRNVVPGVQGALFGLKGVTATERLYQLQVDYSELERENEELRRQNAGLLSRVKENTDHLMAGVREVQLARKELTAARSDLDRLRKDQQVLREKIRTAEREHAAVLQSMGPLLQQMLESDDLSALPPKPAE